MNKRRLAAIARWLERGCPKKGGVAGFNMRLYNQETECGTVCCIAGTTVHWWGTRKYKYPRLGAWSEEPFYFDTAAGILDLNGDDAVKLFATGRSDIAMHVRTYATPAIAARCIRTFIKTGVVDWEAACKEPKGAVL